MAYNCKIFEVVSATRYVDYTHVCTVFEVIGINTEKICLANKEYIIGHW